VTTRRAITVTAWTATQSRIVSNKRTHKRFLPPVVIGLAGTLALHTLVLQTAIMRSLAHKIHPPEVQQPGLSRNSNANPAESLVFVDPKTVSTDHVNDQVLTSVRAILEKTPITVTPPDPSLLPHLETLALKEEKSLASSVDSGDGTERARLFGIYIGQIQARVERIWRRPRSPITERARLENALITDESFQCRVQIVQDAKGYVQEVLLPRCNGSTAWQRSLVLAIQQASPLPAPPSPTVFSHSIALNFVGLPYIAGAPEDDYEIVPIRTVQTLSTFPESRPLQSLPLPDFASRKPSSSSPDNESSVGK
jgi:hypothetical protein